MSYYWLDREKILKNAWYIYRPKGGKRKLLCIILLM